MNETSNYAVTAAYFSPTEGTEHSIRILAENISDSVSYMDMTLPKNREKQVSFSEYDLLILGCPVYAGQMPPVEGLFENLEGHNTPCVIMAAYGNRHYDDALAQMKQRLTQNGFICIAAIACIIPHVFSEKLGANRPDNDDLTIISKFSQKVKLQLKNGSCTAISVPGNENPEPKAVNPMPKSRDEKLCNQCQACVHNCPVGAINPDTFAIDDALCINCMRCAKICKQQARAFDNTNVKIYLESNYLARREIEVY